MSDPEILYSIFVSSTADLVPYRTRARDIILTYNMRPIAMEYFPAEFGPTKDSLRRYLDASDGLVLIAGARYGSRADGKRSYVEWEFDEALEREIPVACLILSEVERSRSSLPADEAERDEQERFIARLKRQSRITEFDSANFDRALAGALTLLPKHFRRNAGLIRVSDYHETLTSARSQLQNQLSYEKFLRLLSGLALIKQHSQLLRVGGKRSMHPGDDRAMLDSLLEVLYQDVVDRPVTAHIVEKLVGRLVNRLQNFGQASGFVPDSIDELEVSIDELFADTLSTLKATSIHSNHDALVAYKGYWHDEELGPFFKRRNTQFLSRNNNGQRLLRIFVCDSLATSVAEDWFTDTVIQQVQQGAFVKVIQIDPDRIPTYEDFGVYEHRSGNHDAGTYLLLAPRERNLDHQHQMTTCIIAHQDVVREYNEKFDKLWNQSNETLELLASSPELEEAHRLPLEKHGQGTIASLFDNRIILRRMERLDTKERLTSSISTLRKYQYQYTKSISEHIKLRFPGVKRLLYVGDTHKNDGAVIRNLQTIGWDVNGFICEPPLRINRLWFNKVLYTNEWADLVGFIHKVRHNVGSDTLAIFDIDQTLWAPKGVHEAPLAASRTRAMTSLIDRYCADPEGDVARRAKARIELLYHEISEVKYLPLTLDNEDFKAAICVFLGLNVVFDQHRLEIADSISGAAFFEELGRLNENRFLELVRDNYISTFVHPELGGEANITHFIMQTLSAAETNQYHLYGERNGIDLPHVTEDLRDVFRETVGNSSIQYRAFRAKELAETLRLVSGSDGFSQQLVLSKPVWDVAEWLKQQGANLLALSDRPDESTVSARGESLLEVSMTIYGKDIAEFLSSEPGE